MDNLVGKCEHDKLFRFLLSNIGVNNKPVDFVEGEKVIVLRSIDSHIMNDLKYGSLGVINSISQRYKGRPAEHYEFWVTSGGKKSRYETYQILKYNEVDQFLKSAETIN
tara:strand:+ start:722 stop:1048 length:327 start_codon:yes stop_codon:yes gene_type:complete